MQIVKLKFRKTSKKGFLVTLTQHNQPLEIEGFLPLFSSLLKSSFEQWRTAYRQLEEVRLYTASKSGFRLTPKSVTVISHSTYTQAVKTHLNQWLNCDHQDWQLIREGLISLAHQFHYGEDEEIQLIIDADDINLRRLPWQEWDLLEKYYPHTEVAFSTSKGKPSPLNANLLTTSDKFNPSLSPSIPRILVVIGKSNEINTQADLEIIQESVKEAEIICLMQPNLKELCEVLWDTQGYNIFIFTGHSGSKENGQIGWIDVNEKESLSIEAFRDALKTAINNGLQLAIFNSCDGLGLANQLADLNLPQSIVMREPIPDEVAIDFLQYFLKEFTANKSLFTAVQIAKKRLEHFKYKYPGASWLPTLCIKPTVTPLTWQEFSQNNLASSSYHKKNLIKSIISIIIIIILSFGLGLGVQSWWPIFAQSFPNFSYSTLKSLRNYPHGTWQYSGSTSWNAIRNLVDHKIKQYHPDFNLVYTPHPTLPPGSGTGIKMLLDGEISFAQSSRPINNDEYQLANQRGLKLQQIPIAIDSLAVVVNTQLKIEKITIKQLKDIYLGKIRNWNQLGGENQEIIPYLRSNQSGTQEFFQENILGQKTVSENVIFVNDTTLALNQLTQGGNLGGIYLASTAEVINQCQVKALSISRHWDRDFITPYQAQESSTQTCNNKLNFKALQNGDYPLTRRLFLILENNDQIDEKVGNAYQKFLWTDEAQKLIKKAGFIPLRIF